MSNFPYQIGIIGDYGPHQAAVRTTIETRFSDLGLSNADYRVLLGRDIEGRDRRAPFAAVFFGYKGARSVAHPELLDALADSAVILPVVDDLRLFSKSIPPELRHINGLERSANDPTFEIVVSNILENFRLLRRDRRLFISYRRVDFTQIALQLYEALDRRGFDVFLDTHGVPPGKDFQSVLWHRLADSDVVVLLDTPNFLDSRWTEQELARAIATNIQVLHLLWPGQTPDARSALNKYFLLKPNSFTGATLGELAKLDLRSWNELP